MFKFMFNWFKKNKKQAEIVTDVHDVKEQSSVKVQNVNHSTAENVVCAEQVNDSFNNIHHYTITYNYYSETAQKEIQVLVNIHHLPEPTTALIGRKTELAQLTERFTDGKTRLAIIVAAGGIGKSALTDEWLQQIATENYYGKTRVFAWSFYSQGSHNTFTNSQPFFSAVLPFLGINEVPKDEIEKARLLARCLREQPCLLILDGLEPLQYAENLQSMNGGLQDSALKEFIACFRQTAGKSFVLFSSRQPLVELKKWQPEHFLSLDLKTLPHQDGAELLQALGVTGKTAERQAISQDLNGHALSLVLFGHLLSEHHQGDCRYAKELDHFPLYQRGTEGDFEISPNPSLSKRGTDSDAEKDSRHALRVLDYYDSLQDAASRCFLQLLGLFDRPMNAAEKAVLIANANHAEPLRALNDAEWKKLEQRLENTGLLLGKKGTFKQFLEWDTHPIIRAYFGDKFKNDYPESFKQAHYVLFEYFQFLPEKEFEKYQPESLNEMLPLYRAVVHGCLAGEYEKSLNIYSWRIGHGNKGYNTHNLGAYSQNLIALSAFFSQDWSINKDLEETSQAWLLAEVSFCLMSLGRLAEAIVPNESATKLSVNTNNWSNAITSTLNLCDLFRILGKLHQAKILVEQVKKYSNYSFEIKQASIYSKFATVSYCLGQLKHAQQKFVLAERLLQRYKPNYIYLYSDVGAAYCALLLNIARDTNDLNHILQRGIYGLDVSKKTNQLLDIALNYLVLAFTYQSLQQVKMALKKFNLAMDFIQKSKKINYFPYFYLARSDFYLTQNQLENAATDLNSAWEIIERSGMKLYQVDYLLIHGRYSLATADFDTALNHYQEAKQLISETGYHLRDAELDLFAAQICQYTKQVLDSQNADYYLQKAKNRIEEIGQWGLLPRLEQHNRW